MYTNTRNIQKEAACRKSFTVVGTFRIELKLSPALADLQALLIQSVDEEEAWEYPVHGSRSTWGMCIVLSADSNMLILE